MDYQEAPVNRLHTTQPEDSSLRAGVSDVIRDVLTLAELQWQLATEDGVAWRRKSVWAGVVAAAGAVCALAALPVIMMGVAQLLVEAGVQRSWALLGTGIVGAALGLLALYIGCRSVARSFSVFNRSQTELRRNIEWLKQSLNSETKSGSRQAAKF